MLEPDELDGDPGGIFPEADEIDRRTGGMFLIVGEPSGSGHGGGTIPEVDELDASRGGLLLKTKEFDANWGSFIKTSITDPFETPYSYRGLSPVS